MTQKDIELDIELLNLQSCQKSLKPRPRDAHKALFGHVLVVGGDYGMAGAVLLAGTAALRTGAGLVTIATRPEHATEIFTSVPKLMTQALHTTQDLTELLRRVTVILVGPGLGHKEWGRDLFHFLLQPEYSEIPMVVDADALNLLSSSPEVRENWVLTPHPGEAGRLLGCSIESIQQNRLESLTALKKKYHGTIVLKGSGSLVLGEDDIPKRCEQGNPGMASPGMGDVLSGIITGLIAEGLSLQDATALAVVAHATAGDLVQKYQGERGILASDLLEYLPKCLNP